MSLSDVVHDAGPTADAEQADNPNVEAESRSVPPEEYVPPPGHVSEAGRVPDEEHILEKERVPDEEHLIGPEHPPDDIAQFNPHASTGELLGQIRRLRGQHERATYAGFCCRWATIQRLDAMKVNARTHDEFVQGCHDCGLGYSLAQDIIRWRLPERAIEIWQRVMAEANAARAQEKWYEFPSFTKMVGWYKKKPMPTAKAVTDEGDEGAEGDEGEAGRNRTPRQLRVDNLHLEDENRKLTLRMHKVEQELAETRERDDQHWQLARERQQQIVTLRDELVRVQGEAASLREQVNALQPAETVTRPTWSDAPFVPPLEPDHDVAPGGSGGTRPVVLADVVLTDQQRDDINARFELKPWPGKIGVEDDALMTKRAAILHAGQFNEADVATLRRSSKGFVRKCAALDDVIQWLPTERERQVTAALTRKNSKAKSGNTEGKGKLSSDDGTS